VHANKQLFSHVFVQLKMNIFGSVVSYTGDLILHSAESYHSTQVYLSCCD